MGQNDEYIRADSVRPAASFSRLERILHDNPDILSSLMGHLFPSGNIFIYAYEVGNARTTTTRTTS